MVVSIRVWTYSSMVLLTMCGIILLLNYHLLKNTTPSHKWRTSFFQRDVFSGAQWFVTICDVQYQILKKLFLNMICFLIWSSSIEKINNWTCVWLFHVFSTLVGIRCCGNIQTSPKLQNVSKQHDNSWQLCHGPRCTNQAFLALGKTLT
jgi:hypothetical protein